MHRETTMGPSVTSSTRVANRPTNKLPMCRQRFGNSMANFDWNKLNRKHLTLDAQPLTPGTHIRGYIMPRPHPSRWQMRTFCPCTQSQARYASTIARTKSLPQRNSCNMSKRFLTYISALRTLTMQTQTNVSTNANTLSSLPAPSTIKHDTQLTRIATRTLCYTDCLTQTDAVFRKPSSSPNYLHHCTAHEHTKAEQMLTNVANALSSQPVSRGTLAPLRAPTLQRTTHRRTHWLKQKHSTQTFLIANQSWFPSKHQHMPMPRYSVQRISPSNTQCWRHRINKNTHNFDKCRSSMQIAWANDTIMLMRCANKRTTTNSNPARYGQPTNPTKHKKAIFNENRNREHKEKTTSFSPSPLPLTMRQRQPWICLAFPFNYHRGMQHELNKLKRFHITP